MEILGSMKSPCTLTLDALFSERIEQVFQSVNFDFVHNAQHVTQFSLGETFVGKPDDIGFRQIDQQPVGVFAEWHAVGSQFE